MTCRSAFFATALALVASACAAGDDRPGKIAAPPPAVDQRAAAQADVGPGFYRSRGPDRAAAEPLDGQAVDGDLYAFFALSADAGDVDGVRRVDLFLDGTHVRNEEVPPFDLGGGDEAAAAPLAGLDDGEHTVAAEVRYADGATERHEATFTVGDGAPAPEATSTTTTTTSPHQSTTTAPPAPEGDGDRESVGPLPSFSPDSFWYEEIPEDAPLHPRSADLAADFDRQRRDAYGEVAINTDEFAPPIFTAGPGARRRAVEMWDCQDKGFVDPGWQEQMQAVPLPAGLAASPGTDAELVIHDPSTDTLWELWKARRRPDGRWEACWGGRLDGVSSSQGIFPNPYGTTATGLSLAGGIITPEELEKGRIEHALAVSLVSPKRGEISWPANRTDGWSDRDTAIPEGLRLRLDPSIDVDRLDISRTAKIVAEALQTYGMVVRDKSGSVTFYARNVVAEGGSDPYPELFGGEPGWRVLAGIPWDRLQALPVDYGKP